MAVLHRSGAESHFFTHQFADDFFWGSVTVCGFNTQPVGGKIVYKDNAPCVFRKKAAFPVAGQLGRMLRPVFVKSVVFFIGHIGHQFLLSFEQRQESVSALHSMTDTCLSYAFMFERGWNAFDDDFHAPHYSEKSKYLKTTK